MDAYLIMVKWMSLNNSLKNYCDYHLCKYCNVNKGIILYKNNYYCSEECLKVWKKVEKSYEK